MNVGASKPTEYGKYFQWGDTVGYTSDQIGTGEGKKKFARDWSDYKWGVQPNFTKYTESHIKLELEDDAAHVNMGGDWHMPTDVQIHELIDNTTTAWTTPNDIDCITFTSKNNKSKSIFIPVAGFAVNGSIGRIGSECYVLSSILNGFIDAGECLVLDDHGGVWFSTDSTTRYFGCSVRGVIG